MRIGLSCAWLAATIFLGVEFLPIEGISVGHAVAQELSRAEELYAELAKLAPAERQQRLVEGARREGALTADSTCRGAVGREQYELFQKRYAWLKVEFDND